MQVAVLTQDNLEVETFKKLFVGPDYTEFFDLLALLLKFQTYRFCWVGLGLVMVVSKIHYPSSQVRLVHYTGTIEYVQEIYPQCGVCKIPLNLVSQPQTVSSLNVVLADLAKDQRPIKGRLKGCKELSRYRIFSIFKGTPQQQQQQR